MLKAPYIFRKSLEFRGTVWIKKDKVKYFRVLFLKIAKEKGSQMNARKFIPIHGSTVDDLNQGKVTVETGKRILNAYNLLFNNKKISKTDND